MEDVEEEVEQSQTPGKRDEDITTIDENTDTINRHELELSLLRDELDKVRYNMDEYVPLNMIAMYVGAEADVPDMWHLCNGQGGTIDLRDKFVMGSTYNDIGDEGGFADIEQTLPEHTHQLDHHFHVLDPHNHTISNQHSHNIADHSHNQSSHAHSFSSSVPAHTHSMSHDHGATDQISIDSHHNVGSQVWTYPGGTTTVDISYQPGSSVMTVLNHHAFDHNYLYHISSGFNNNYHAHNTSGYSGETGEGGGGGGGGDTGPANPAIESTSLDTDDAHSDYTDELGEVNTQTAGDGDTWPAGADISGAGKNLPPYYSLAFIQKVA